MLKILYTRHGTTEWNEKNLIQGQIEIPLNEKGREDARRLGEQLKDTKIDLIYSSPLGRAYETACIIRGDRKIDIIKDDMTILVVAHGGMSRLVDCYFKDLDNDSFVNHVIPNCSLFEYEY